MDVLDQFQRFMLGYANATLNLAKEKKISDDAELKLRVVLNLVRSSVSQMGV